MKDDPYALEHVRVDPSAATKIGRRPRGWRRMYVLVPWTWVERLRDTGRASAYQLAFALLYAAWKGGQPISVSNGFAAAHAIPPRTKWDALRELERLDLVVVERRSSKSPLVTLRHIDLSAITPT